MLAVTRSSALVVSSGTPIDVWLSDHPLIASSPPTIPADAKAWHVGLFGGTTRIVVPTTIMSVVVVPPAGSAAYVSLWLEDLP